MCKGGNKGAVMLVFDIKSTGPFFVTVCSNKNSPLKCVECVVK